MALPVSELLACPAFSRSLNFETLDYQTTLPSKAHIFHATWKTKEYLLCLAHIIWGEESLAWKSCYELFNFSLKTAAQGMRGFFGFQLLTTDLRGGLKHFSPQEFAQLLINHSKTLNVGEMRLVRYGLSFGILHKRVPEEWGKIDFMAPVEVFNRPLSELDLYIKKLWRESLNVPERSIFPTSARLPASPELQRGEPARQGKLAAAENLAAATVCRIYLICDLGSAPVFRFGHEEQTARLAKLFGKTTDLPLIYVVHASGTAELGLQLGFRKEETVC